MPGGLRAASSCLLLTLAASAQTTWYVETVAGEPRALAENSPALSAYLSSPRGLILDSAGNLIFSDTGNHRVRRIAPSGIISTIAGSGVPGNSGDGGPATAARLLSPWGLTLDSSGALYIADRDSHVIRRVTPDGIISTFAGTGVPGATGTFGTGSPATAANLLTPVSLAFDRTGSLYIGEELANTIRIVRPTGRLDALSQSSYANPQGLAFDAAGNLYIALTADNRIFRLTPSGAGSVFAGADGSLKSPTALAFDSAGNLYVCDTGNNRLRRITPEGVATTVAGSGSRGLTVLGGDAVFASVYEPSGIAVNSQSALFWSESGNHRIRTLNPVNRIAAEIAGASFPLNSPSALTLTLRDPLAVTADPSGNIFISDTGNNLVRRVPASGPPALAAGTGQPQFIGDFGDATAINLTRPGALSADATGFLFIADTGNSRIRRVSPDGAMTTVMGLGATRAAEGAFIGSASIAIPGGVTGEGSGAFSALDSAAGLVARADTTGTVTLPPLEGVSALSNPSALFTTATTVWIADTDNHRIIRIDPFDPASFKPRASVVAGTGRPGYSGDSQEATKAQLSFPSGVIADSQGRIFIADTGNHVIRMVDTDGSITTIAGSGKPGFSGDQGPAILAQFAQPSGLAFDNSGGILIADKANQRIRRLRPVATGPDVLLTVDPPSRPALRGSSVTFNITLNAIGNYTGPSGITAAAPGGITIQFSPPDLRTILFGVPRTITATVFIPFNAPAGLNTITFQSLTGTARTATATLDVPPTPATGSTGIVNAASGLPGPVAPGEILAIYGSDLGPAALTPSLPDSSGTLPTSIAGTQVFFDGIAAPLLYASASQLAVVAPYAIAGKASTEIQIISGRLRSPLLTLPVTDAAPALFNIPGTDRAAALNQNLSVNSPANPAARGGIVVLYGTGEGLLSPPVPDGRITGANPSAPVLPVEVTIGGIPAIVFYAASAPAQVAGMFQLNVRIPPEVGPGQAPVSVFVGSRQSSGLSTISIR